MTDNLDDLIKVCERATGGEWKRDMHGHFVGVKTIAGADVVGWNGFDSSDFTIVQQKANAEYIATFNPQRCLALLKELKRLREESEVYHAADYSSLATNEEALGYRHERDELGKAIAEAAIKVGIIDGTMPLTGPQLIMLCADLARGEQTNEQAVDLERS